MQPRAGRIGAQRQSISRAIAFIYYHAVRRCVGVANSDRSAYIVNNSDPIGDCELHSISVRNGEQDQHRKSDGDKNLDADPDADTNANAQPHQNQLCHAHGDAV